MKNRRVALVALLSVGLLACNSTSADQLGDGRELRVADENGAVIRLEILVDDQVIPLDRVTE